MGKLGTLTADDAWAIETIVKNPEVAKRMYNEDAVLKHLKSDLRIIIDEKELSKISGTPGTYKFIEGKARLINATHNFNTKLEVSCKIASTQLSKLKPLIKNSEVNVLDHLDILIPKIQKGVGLFTFQNGIQNKLSDFEEMGNSIINKLPEKPLCIGFYNTTDGKLPISFDDLQRMFNEWHLNANSVMIFRQTLTTFARVISDFLKKNQLSANTITPNFLWTHIAHSEGGLIVHEVLTAKNYNLFQQDRGIDAFLKNHMIILTYGAVAPVPNVVYFARNTYSRDDITMFFAKNYLDKRPRPRSNDDDELKKLAKQMHEHHFFPKSQSAESIYTQLKSGTDKFYIQEYPHHSKKDNYSLTIVESEVPKPKQPKVEGDHAFAGDTYQKALEENIALLRKNYGIYVGR